MAINILDDDVFKRNRNLLPKEELPIEIEPSQNDFTTSVKYETSSIISQGVSNSNDTNTYDLDAIKNRIGKKSDELKLFLYNLFPYIGTNVFSGITNFRNQDNATINSIASSARLGITALQNLKYLTVGELALLYAHNFYTLHFFRGISIKKGKTGNFGISDPSRTEEIWNGQPDIFYGATVVPSYRFSDLTQAIEAFIGENTLDEEKDANTHLQKYKDELTPRINLSSGRIEFERKVKPKAIFDPLNKQVKSSFTNNATIGVQEQTNGRWNVQDDPSKITRGVFSRLQLASRNASGNNFIDETVKDIISRRIIYDNGRIETTNDTDRISSSNAEFRQSSTDPNEYFVNKDVLSIPTRNFEVEDGSWILGQEIRIDSNAAQFREIRGDGFINKDVNKLNSNILQEENGRWAEVNQTEVDYKDAQLRKTNVTEQLEYLNENVINVSFKRNPVGDSSAANMQTGSIRDLVRSKGFTKGAAGKWQLGAIHVIPVVPDSFGQTIPRFFIPFEFNPNIAESGLQASYNSTSILSRIGELQSFSGVNSLKVTIDTEYLAVSHDSTLSDTNGQGWMTYFTLERIQATEMIYRSLILPHFPNQSSLDTGYRYIKPPLLKVVMGNPEDRTSPYSGLLSYHSDKVVENRLRTSENYGGRILKTFIATGINITKDLNETPVHLDEDKTLRDTFGFKVSIDLIEVTPSYMDMMPDYKNHYDHYVSVVGSNILR